MLDRRNKSLKDIVDVLRVYRANVEVDENDMQEDNANSQQEILDGLLAFLEAC
jgi:beta-catenin-like protein 1